MVNAAISSAAFLGAPTSSILKEARAAGITAVEWSSDHGVEAGDLDAAGRVMLDTLRAGLCNASYATLFRAGVHSVDRFKTLLATARALQAPYIRLWAAPKSDDVDADAAFFAEAARTLANISAESGVTLCFGLAQGSAMDSYERAVELMGAADHPFVKLCWEPLPGVSFDAAMEYFGQLKGRVGILCARSAGAVATNRLLRDKDEDWLLYLDAFDEQGGSPDMVRYVVIRAFKDGQLTNLADDARLLRTWSVKLRRYYRRRLYF
ncbi:MAG TPA: TIM barrel protein [Spirochaetales bacterium]|nr:TIM barrel protein [Spirochaetales bacterium]